MVKCFLCKEIGFEDKELRTVDLGGEQKVKICDFCFELGQRYENQQYDKYLSEVFC